MKKAIVGAGALLAASILPVANVFAIDPLDYAKSVGSIGGADTINWVVEATSDGGYVVGGQTVGCYKYEGGDSVKAKAKAVKNTSGELVEWSECEEYFANMPDKERVSVIEAKDADLPSIMDICGGNQLEVALDASVARGDDGVNYWYNISCIDYIAKFKKDGTKEWLTLVNDSSRPTAVAETKNEYRMLVQNSALYTFAKTGDEGLSTNLQYNPNTNNSIINNDGSMVVGDYGDVCYFGANASLVRCAGQDEDENVSYYPAGFNGGMIRSDDSIILVRVIDGGEEEDTFELVRATKDLKTITPITNVNTDGMDGVLFGNKDGDFAVVNCKAQGGDVAYGKMSALADEAPQVACKIVSYDKNGNKIAEKDINDLGIDSVDKIMPKDFVIIERDGTLVRFDRNLNIVLEHTLSENETLNDVAPLNDGSVVGVGVSTGTTDNYEVDTNANGVYLRLDVPTEQPAAPSTPDNVKNPGTLDAIQIFAGLGGVILLAGAIAGRKLMTRR